MQGRNQLMSRLLLPSPKHWKARHHDDADRPGWRIRSLRVATCDAVYKMPHSESKAGTVAFKVGNPYYSSSLINDEHHDHERPPQSSVLVVGQGERGIASIAAVRTAH